ncbi:MAG: LemA family protein [Microgenomates group bacterium]
MNKTLISIVAILVFLGLVLAGVYNNLISLNQKVDLAWAQVDTQYQRRFDLIPNLVSSVQGEMKQEQKIFSDIATARTQYSGAASVNDKATAATALEGTLGRLLVIMENYPVLKSNENVTRLMDELAGTENRISVERSRFNNQVTTYNMVVIRFPGNLLARLFGFSSRAFFQSASGADVAPRVEINP